MSSAIELVVEHFARLGNRRGLENAPQAFGGRSHVDQRGSIAETRSQRLKRT